MGRRGRYIILGGGRWNLLGFKQREICLNLSRRIGGGLEVYTTCQRGVEATYSWRGLGGIYYVSEGRGGYSKQEGMARRRRAYPPACCKACLYDGKLPCSVQDLSRKHPGYIPLPYIGPGFTRTQLLAVYPPTTAAAAATADRT